VLAVISIIGAGCERPATVEQQQVNSQPENQIAKETEQEPPPLLLEEDPPLLLDEEPPLLLDEEPLLLLDDDEGSGNADAGPQADNSRCFVCHVNYMDEDIAVTHAGVGMGCAHCHGESDEHIADESWASGGNGTAPETMFPKPKINPFCMSCHPKEKIDAAQHQPLFANMEKMVCTDCHGKHRITTPRKCKWK